MGQLKGMLTQNFIFPQEWVFSSPTRLSMSFINSFKACEWKRNLQCLRYVDHRVHQDVGKRLFCIFNSSCQCFMWPSTVTNVPDLLLSRSSSSGGGWKAEKHPEDHGGTPPSRLWMGRLLELPGKSVPQQVLSAMHFLLLSFVTALALQWFP